jgi:hypothetical protein
MSEIDYSAARVPVREDILQAHAAFFEHLRSPGTWWTGAERIAIAAESRSALACPLCRERKSSRSPEQVPGEHASLGSLPADAVEVIHRVRTDPARLSRRWFEARTRGELSVEQYVELVGLVTLLTGIDVFCRALGTAPPSLPEPIPGAPTRERPDGLKEGIAWVPILAPEDAGPREADLYAGLEFVPNIVRALSRVPEQVRALRAESDPHYIPMHRMSDPTYGRDLDRMQIELVAGRVSALNECFY